MEDSPSLGSPDWIINHILNEIDNFIEKCFKIELRIFIQTRGEVFSNKDIVNIQFINAYTERLNRHNQTISAINKNAIYFLFDSGKIVYIGMTCRDIKTRMQGHKKNKKFTEFSYFMVYIPRKSLFKLEAILINRFNPILNKTKKKPLTDI